MSIRIHVVTERPHGESRLYISQPFYEWDHALAEIQRRASHAMEFSDRVVLELRHRYFTEQELAELSNTEVEDLVRRNITTKQEWRTDTTVRIDHAVQG